jgi:putative membrane protein
MSFIVELLVTALAMFFWARIVPGIHVNDFGSAIIAALVFGIVNATLGFVLRILTFPLNFLTLGLTSFLIGVIMILLVGKLLNGFRVDNFTAAFLLALILMVAKVIFSKS